VQRIVVQDEAVVRKLAECKAAGAGMLKGAAAAIAVIGDADAADGWVEDCSIVMTQMMLRATELGVGNCWCQMRMRFQKEEGPDGPAVSADDAVRAVLGYPEPYKLEAVLSLGMIDEQPEPHTESYAKAEMVHWDKF
jgi:nitroreductase